MKKWTEKELELFNWFKTNYDSKAILLGGSNANVPDIISHLYGNGEIKSFPAQCGQFTKSTVKENKYSENIISKSRNDVTAEEATQWVKEHYKLKDIKFFITDYKNTKTLYSFNEFFNEYYAELELREAKKSGSRSLPKFAYKLIPKEWNPIERNGKIFVDNKQYYNCEYQYKNQKNQNYIMFVSPDKDGEIRTKSNTKNETWIFKLQKVM